MIIQNIIIPYGSTIGGSFVVGILLGYFIKKIIKILMFILGGIVALLLFLQNQDIILINHDKLDNSLMSLTLYLTNAFGMISHSDPLTVPVTASASVGFIIGLRA
jgi:uncharacterized membrane protein (Fun14 family)